MLAAGTETKRHVQFAKLQVEIQDDGPKRLPLTLLTIHNQLFGDFGHVLS